MKRNNHLSKPILAAFASVLGVMVLLAIKAPDMIELNLTAALNPAPIESQSRVPAAVEPPLAGSDIPKITAPASPVTPAPASKRMTNDEVDACTKSINPNIVLKLRSNGLLPDYCRDNCDASDTSQRGASCSKIAVALDSVDDCKKHKENSEKSIKNIENQCEKASLGFGTADANVKCFGDAKTCLDDLDDLGLEDKTLSLRDCKEIKAIAGGCFDIPIEIEKKEEEKEKEKAKTTGNGEKGGINIKIDGNKELEKSAAEKLAEADKELAKALREISDKQRQAFVDYRKKDLDVDKQYVEIRDKQRLREVEIAQAKDNQLEMCIKYANDRFQTEEAKIARMEAEIKAAKQAQRFNVAANMLAYENRLRQKKIASRRVTVWNTFYYECMEGRGPGSRFINAIRQAQRMLLNENAKAEDLSKVLEKERNNAYLDLNDSVMSGNQDRSDIINATSQTKQAIQTAEMEKKQEKLKKEMEEMYKKALDANTPDDKKECPISFVNKYNARRSALKAILGYTDKTAATCQRAKTCTTEKNDDCADYAALKDTKKGRTNAKASAFLASGPTRKSLASTPRADAQSAQKRYITSPSLYEATEAVRTRQHRNDSSSPTISK